MRGDRLLSFSEARRAAAELRSRGPESLPQVRDKKRGGEAAKPGVSRGKNWRLLLQRTTGVRLPKLAARRGALVTLDADDMRRIRVQLLEPPLESIFLLLRTFLRTRDALNM